MNSIQTSNPQEMSASISLWRKLGWAGFLFFLIKGFLWLAAPAVFYFLT